MPSKFLKPLAIIFLSLLPLTLSAQGWPRLLRQADSLARAASYAQAEAACTQAIGLIDTTRNQAALFEALATRAKCRKATGNYRLALDDYNRATALCQKNSSLMPHRDIVAINKSDLLIATGQYEEAVETLTPIEAQSGSDIFTHRLNNLAIALSQTSRHDEATAMLTQLINDAPDSLTAAAALQNRAFISCQQARYAEAAADFTKALALIGSPDSRRFMTTLSNRAVARSLASDHSQAVSDIVEALGWMAKSLGTSHPDYLIALRKKFEILLRAQRGSEAVTAATAFFNAQKDFIAREFPGYTQQRRLNYWKMLKPQLSALFSLEKEADAQFLYNVALFRRAISLLPTEATQTDLQQAASTTEADVRKKLRTGQCAIEFACFAHLLTADTLYAATVSLPAQKPRFVPLFSQRQLNAISVNGKSVRDAIASTYATDKDSLYTCDALASLVWQPIFQALPAATKQIFFAPDGILHTLAIEYLPHPALAGKEIHRLTSTSRLARKTASAPSATAGALIVGGLNYSLTPSVQATAAAPAETQPSHEAAELLRKAMPQGQWFTPLPHAATETQAIGTLLPQATRRDTMSEEDITAMLESHSLVHLATHGYAILADAQPESPFMTDSLTEDRSLLASGLAFTGANDAWRNPALNDGILSAKEISTLRLSGLALTVLSACQTALGETSDEGPAGIVRGLKKAGAGTVVATLWPVNDQSTELFMQTFYRLLAQGKTTHAAFCQARDALRLHTETVATETRYNPSRMAMEAVALDPPRQSRPYSSPSFTSPYILIDDI